MILYFVMYASRVVETASVGDLFDQPQHPYTQALLSAVPIPDPVAERHRKRIILEGDVPSPAHPPKGCNFSTRCPRVMDICRVEKPPMKELKPRHGVACHLCQTEETA